MDETEVSAAQRASLKPNRKLFVGESPRTGLSNPNPPLFSDGSSDNLKWLQRKPVLSGVVSSADALNEPSDGDVSQGLDGHGPLLSSQVTPVNPSLRTQSWGDVVSSWDDGVSSNESCVMTELPRGT